MSQTTPHSTTPAKAPETAAAISRQTHAGEPDSRESRSGKRPPDDASVAIKVSATRTSPLSAERHQMIAQAAYFRAEQRGFAGGQEVEDWLAAEAEIDQLLNADKPPRA